MEALRWTRSSLWLLDQTKLPHEEIWHTYKRADDVAQAILEMKVRGAPAIGAAGAFAVAIEAANSEQDTNLRRHLADAIEHLRASRPTAVNLSWALDQMLEIVNSTETLDVLPDALFAKATAIANEDIAVNRAIGQHGLSLFQPGVRMLTHCNTGSLATVGYGTALGIIRALHENKMLQHVYVDETRPYLQGARLTAYELMHEQIPFDIITDSMAGHIMKDGQVDAIVVGADRVARNGDTANKIGTYSLAVLARHHNIPFYVAAPLSTIDVETVTGKDIPIEQRNAEEVTHIFGQSIAPLGSTALHPAFDVTPAELITGIVTEHGVVRAPYTDQLVAMKRGEIPS